MLPQIEVPPHQITTFVRMVLSILNEYARNWTSEGEIPLASMINVDNSATGATPTSTNTYMRQQGLPSIAARVATRTLRIPEAFSDFNSAVQADISAAFHQTGLGNVTIDSTYHTQTPGPGSYGVPGLELSTSQQNTAAEMQESVFLQATLMSDHQGEFPEEMATFSSLNYSNLNRGEQGGQDPFPFDGLAEEN